MHDGIAEARLTCCNHMGPSLSSHAYLFVDEAVLLGRHQHGAAFSGSHQHDVGAFADSAGLLSMHSLSEQCWDD